MTTPLSFNETFANTSSTLLRFGEQCFDVLAWTVVAAIGRRNVYGCLVSAGVMQVMSSIGTLIGAMSGHITNDFVHTDFFMATGFALTMVFAFFAFLWCGFRSFSFTDAIKSVTAVSHPSSGEQGEPAGGSPLDRNEAPAAGAEDGFTRVGNAEHTAAGAASTPAEAAKGYEAEGARQHEPGRSDCKEPPAQRHGFGTYGESDADTGKTAGAITNASGEEPASEAGTAAPAPDQLDENCARLSDEFGLTAREREVFVLLAHGRNGRYIMDHLVISRNTAKSHIKHIYSKLGVHSHQELIDLATRRESL